MRTTALKLATSIILIVLLSIRITLFFTGYSITNSIVDYLINIVIASLLALLIFQTSLPRQFKIFVFISILVVVTARIDLNYFMSMVGERTVEKLGTWKVGEYTIIKQLDVGWAGVPYESSFLVKSKLAGLIVKRIPTQQIDSCTFMYSQKDRSVLINVCNQKVVEDSDRTDH